MRVKILLLIVLVLFAFSACKQNQSSEQADTIPPAATQSNAPVMSEATSAMPMVVPDATTPIPSYDNMQTGVVMPASIESLSLLVLPLSEEEKGNALRNSQNQFEWAWTAKIKDVIYAVWENPSPFAESEFFLIDNNFHITRVLYGKMRDIQANANSLFWMEDYCVYKYDPETGEKRVIANNLQNYLIIGNMILYYTSGTTYDESVLYLRQIDDDSILIEIARGRLMIRGYAANSILFSVFDEGESETLTSFSLKDGSTRELTQISGYLKGVDFEFLYASEWPYIYGIRLNNGKKERIFRTPEGVSVWDMLVADGYIYAILKSSVYPDDGFDWHGLSLYRKPLKNGNWKKLVSGGAVTINIVEGMIVCAQLEYEADDVIQNWIIIDSKSGKILKEIYIYGIEEFLE